MTAEPPILRLREDELHWRVVDGEVIALDGKTAVYLSANPAGVLLWHALSEGTTRDRLVARLRSRFDVDEDAAQRDVDAFLEQLAERDLLEPAA